jgi:DNA-binding response OmpR family regulator
MAKRILIIEDEEEIRENLKFLLEAEQYNVIEASNGITGIELAREYQPDLIITDVMMPGISGFKVLEQLRCDLATLQIPIIFLTARNSHEDLREGMQLGADDYICKPFSQKELLKVVQTRLQRVASLKTALFKSVTVDVLSAASSIKNLMSYIDNEDNLNLQPIGTNAAVTQPHIFITKGLSIDFEQHTVMVEGHEVKLSPRQYQLLVYLAENAGKIMTHQNILNKLWGSEYEGDTQYLHVFVNQLRHKLEPDPHNPKFIQTERGIGYRLIPSHQVSLHR